jgi:hypothetical protein
MRFTARPCAAVALRWSAKEPHLRLSMYKSALAHSLRELALAYGASTIENLRGFRTSGDHAVRVSLCNLSGWKAFGVGAHLNA